MSDRAPTPPEQVKLISLERPPTGWEIELGELVAVPVVQASNLVKDARELITNAFGGRMTRYEKLLEIAVDRAQTRFREELSAKGYDGALGVRFAHPEIVAGGAELVIYGTGFRRL